jgi:hypothetical protein
MHVHIVYLRLPTNMFASLSRYHMDIEVEFTIVINIFYLLFYELVYNATLLWNVNTVDTHSDYSCMQ